VVRAARLIQPVEDEDMSGIGASHRDPGEGGDPSSGSTRRGVVRLPVVSTGGIVVVTVLVVLGLAPLRYSGPVVSADESQYLMKIDMCITSAAFSPDGRRLAWSAYGDTILTREWDEGGYLGSTSGFTLERGEANKSLGFSADGSALAVGFFDGRVKLWDLLQRSFCTVLVSPGSTVRSVAFAPDGGVLAAGTADSTIRLWDRATGNPLADLRGNQSGVSRLAFSPVGHTLASSHVDGQVIVWDWSTGRRVMTILPERPPMYGVVPLAFAADGKALAFTTGSSVTFWNLVSRKRIVQVGKLNRPIMALAMSPDGRQIAAGGVDGRIECWEAGTGELRATLRDHEAMICAMAFSTDGRHLMSFGSDGNVRLWLQGQDFPLSRPSR
jgi:WD40 repeat protein